MIQYINDSFFWVKTYWNENAEIKQGLNYYGYTIFKEESILNFKNIIIGWKVLFSNATKMFELSGNYLPDESKYEKHTFFKEEVINNLDKIIELCDRAITLDKHILHMGI